MPENPYTSGGGMKLNTGKMTMQYEMHRAWDEGFAAGAAARTAEIVEWLRTTKGDEWMRGQDAARSVVSRFGGGES